MINFLKNPKTANYLRLKEMVNSPSIPWYYHDKTILGDCENDFPYYSHGILNRPLSANSKVTKIDSSLFEDAYEVIKEILDKNNLQSNVPKAKNVVYCKVCDEPILKGQRSRGKVHVGACAFAWKRVRLKCNWCRTIFYRTRKRVRQGVRLKLENVYCTQECYQNYRKHNQK